MTYLVIAATGAALLLIWAWLRELRVRRRENAIRHLLDGADALEARLQECRERMRQLRGMLTILPEEMSAQADSALAGDAKVQAALRDLLAHRLWIQRNADTATLQQLDSARDALDQSGATLAAQIERLVAITSDLQRAQTGARSVQRPRSP
ncbi:MAG: hypothetical protein ACREPN_00430 [Rudaea sp.]